MIFSIIISIIISLLISLNTRYLGNKIGLVDKPSTNKIHSTNVSLMGGPIIFIVIFIFLITNYREFNYYSYQSLFLSFFFLLGLIDDKINLNSNYKILLVILFSLIMINFDESFLIHKIYFEILDSEYYFGNFKIPITLLCILLLYIAMNMSDGINCLLVSFSIISLLVINYFIFGFSLNILDLSILISLIIIFYFNYKNKTFLGNSGASLLVAYFIYKLINVNYFNQIDVFKVISIYLIMGVDMVRLVILRLINKNNPFARDLKHFHHLLLKKMNLILTISLYLILSFSPILISEIFNFSILFFIPISLMIYFYMIKKLSFIDDK